MHKRSRKHRINKFTIECSYTADRDGDAENYFCFRCVALLADASAHRLGARARTSVDEMNNYISSVRVFCGFVSGRDGWTRG